MADPAPPPALAFGKYRLLRKLAKGGMAEVYLAQAEGPAGFSKTLVLKRILPHLAEDESFVEMFLNEARLAALLNHPNIAQIFDLGEQAGSYYIAMEYIDGPSLRALVRRANAAGKLIPPEHAAKIISLACDGLGYAHDFVDNGRPLNLIHRDISPDNILLSRAGAVKVVDFGIAKAANQPHLTQTGTLKGKLSYMPPEQLKGERLDRRADIFALGIVLYELLAGLKPFDSTSEVATMQSILNDRPSPIRERRPDCPPDLWKIIERALAKKRDKRYPDCHSMQQDLERFLYKSGAPIGAFEISQLIVDIAGAPATVQPASPTPPPPPLSALTPRAPPPPVDIPIELSGIRPADSPPQGSDRPTAVVQRLATLETPAVTPASQPTEAVPRASGPAADVAPPWDSLPLDPPAFGETWRPPGEDSLSPARQPREEGARGRGSAPERRSKRAGAIAAIGVAAALIAAGVGITVVRQQPAEPSEQLVRLAQPQPSPKPPEPAPAVVAEPTPTPAVAVEPTPGPVKPAEPEPTEPTEPTEPPKPSEPTKPAVATPKPTPRPQPAAAPAILVVTTDPPCAVLVDGKPSGSSPVRLSGLAPGTHEVTAVNKEAGLKRRVSVELTAGQTTTESIKFGKGLLVFRVRPWAQVQIDGKPSGETPLPSGIQVYEGEHRVRLFNPDLGKEQIRTVWVTAGKEEIIKVDLSR